MTTFTMGRRLDDTKIEITNDKSSWKKALQIYDQNLNFLRIFLTIFDTHSTFCWDQRYVEEWMLSLAPVA
jgi:hypothetical protein